MRILILACALLVSPVFAKPLSPACLAEIEFEYWKIMRAQGLKQIEFLDQRSGIATEPVDDSGVALQGEADAPRDDAGESEPADDPES